MKKIFVLTAAVFVALGMSSCKSSESAYKKAYEKAQAQQPTETSQVSTSTTQTTAPVAVTPVQTETQSTNNVSVRTENVTLVNGSGLKAYSVVVGSFSVQANAEALQKQLKDKGNDAQVVKSPTDNYRVIIATFDTKDAAASFRNKVIGEYAGAWLLYQK